MKEGTYYVWRNALFLLVKTTGDVMDSTLMHINALPIPIPIPIHQRGLIFLKHDYCYIYSISDSSYAGTKTTTDRAFFTHENGGFLSTPFL